jgi:hypothetical protein
MNILPITSVHNVLLVDWNYTVQHAHGMADTATEVAGLPYI